eukprot:5073280-Prymnesium_polylepis.2
MAVRARGVSADPPKQSVQSDIRTGVSRTLYLFVGAVLPTERLKPYDYVASTAVRLRLRSLSRLYVLNRRFV